jgi:hypothetical protein
MDIVLKRDMADEIGYDKFTFLGFNPASWGYQNKAVNLTRITAKQLDQLQEVMTKHRNTKGTGSILRDISLFRKMKEAGKGAVTMKVKTAKQFAILLKKRLMTVPGHRVYQQQEEIFYPYYVEKITYSPAQTRKEEYYPAYVTLSMRYEEFGVQETATETFYEESCKEGMTVDEMLSDRGYHPETVELRGRYLEEVEKYKALIDNVGFQCLAVGTGTTK